MFAKSLVLASLLALSCPEALSKPLYYNAALERRAEPSLSKRSFSFNNYDGFSSMNNFDNFFGNSNFDGSNNEQIIIIEQDESESFCQSLSIDIIQQKLFILQEVAKQIILEQICEVEVQTIVIEQFSSSFDSFSNDISRSSNRQIGFDSGISGRYNDIFNSDGSLSRSNLGFQGSSIGSSLVVPQGSNWNDNSSPASVGRARQAAQGVANSTLSSSSSTSAASAAVSSSA